MANYSVDGGIKIKINKEKKDFYGEVIRHNGEYDFPRGYIVQVYIEAVDELKRMILSGAHDEDIRNWEVRFELLKQKGIWVSKEERDDLIEVKRKKAQIRICSSIRSRISDRIKARNRNGKSVSIFVKKELGYSIKQLMGHLESKFDENMNWGNYGTYWHIDHIKPESWFKYDSLGDDELKKCWGLDNLQPLEAGANMRKGNRYAG